jgi:hypothetical protein
VLDLFSGNQWWCMCVIFASVSEDIRSEAAKVAVVLASFYFIVQLS